MVHVGQFQITAARYPAMARAGPRIGPWIGPWIVWRLARDRSGIAGIEYAMIASLIAVGIVISVTNLGIEVGNHWDAVAQSVEGG